MSEPLTPAEHHLLWSLVARGGGAFESELKPKPVAAHRIALKRKGLIEVEKREKPSAGRRRTKANHLHITPAGWNRCNHDLSWPVPRARATRADFVLNWLMPRLKSVFDSGDSVASLSDLINKTSLAPDADGPLMVGPAEMDSPVSSVAGQDLRERIRRACLELGGGRQSVRVRIADLRKRLREFTHDQITQELWKLALLNELTLYPLDDPRQITAEDEDAAIRSSTGVPQHILYFGGIAS